MNPQALAGLSSLTNISMPANLPEWIGAAAGVYLFFNGHQVIGGALAIWFGYQAITQKPLVTISVGSFGL